MKKFLLFLLIGAFCAVETFTGFKRSEQVSTEEYGVLRDSAGIYSALERSRAAYTKALTYNEGLDSAIYAAREFEIAVRNLYRINRDTLEKHPGWKKDYSELGRELTPP